MPKQQNTGRPTIASLPGGGVSAKLSDYLKTPAPSARPPIRATSSGGGLPTNKRSGGG